MNRKITALVCVLVALGTAPLALAQSAEQLGMEQLRQSGMSDADIASQVRITTMSQRDAPNGLRVEMVRMVLASGGESLDSSYVAIINPTAERWCFRAKGESTGKIGFEPQSKNRSLRRGQGAILMFMQVGFPYAMAVATWPVNRDEIPNGLECLTAVPEGLEAWLAAPGFDDFRG